MVVAERDLNYILQVGKNGQERLKILNKIHNPHSLNFLQEGCLQEGMKVLDIGCGTGIMSCEIATRVGPLGRVTAVDIRQEQIDLAEEEAKKRELENVKFLKLSADAIETLEKGFDLIYSRFLLSHIPNDEEVLEQALSLLKPGGKIIIEDTAGIDCNVCFPPSNAYNEWVKAVQMQAKIQNTDFNIGYKLPYLLKKRGCMVEKALMYQAMLKNSQEKKILTLGIIECGPSYMQKGFCSKQNLEKVIAELQAFENNDESIAAYTRVGQVAARKQ